ncbi:cellulose-binding domain-containing protein [Streptomyces sp. LP11]|uniref:Cellulose-binding domain-containing protein n=1 Tax=Streptomyces pyxinicus TaxID=2970331 RepID=A0ABT2B0S0_9ACTN|nr:cellulose-binding domain-containing protein [Streptomyces sp. LP11]MCS0602104.1 cellulose-binding domain-containing protein [Streptomyces sp. LP11]
MPDLPGPQDASETVLFSEAWDAVLSYADLCTSGSLTAHQLATEAFTRGMREVRAAARVPTRGAGRRAPRLPLIPALLTAVRDTAVRWEADGQGQRLDPDLRLWLNSPQAARFSGLPLQRPVALRGLRDLPEADASLLWLAEAEALPLSAVARRLGLDPAAVADELDQVRALFRDRCHRAHLDSPLDPECRSYAGLLDAVTRAPGTRTPDDLSRHLATCPRCAEAAACLRPGGGLPAALAGGVVGWGGLAYLERRRRAAEARLGPAAVPETARPADDAGRGRVVRRGLLATAVLLSALALGASLMPFGESAADDTTAALEGRRPVTGPYLLGPTTRAPKPTRTHAPTPTATVTQTAPEREKPAPEPQDASATPAATKAPACRVDYAVDSQWAQGFQATVTVTTDRPLTGWRLSWTFRDGQRLGRTWDAAAGQDGSRATATALGYNKSVTAHTGLTFGFLGTWQDANRTPRDFTLNGTPCTVG